MEARDGGRRTAPDYHVVYDDHYDSVPYPAHENVRGSSFYH